MWLKGRWSGLSLLCCKFEARLLHWSTGNEILAFSQCPRNFQRIDAHTMHKFINPISMVIFRYQGH